MNLEQLIACVQAHPSGSANPQVQKALEAALFVARAAVWLTERSAPARLSHLVDEVALMNAALAQVAGGATCSVCHGTGKVLGDCWDSPNEWYVLCSACMTETRDSTSTDVNKTAAPDEGRKDAMTPEEEKLLNDVHAKLTSCLESLRTIESSAEDKSTLEVNQEIQALRSQWARHEKDCPGLQGPKNVWEDRPDTWTESIKAAFPTKSGSHETYGIALEMVGNRQSKGALVALVNWLLLRLDPTEAGALATLRLREKS